MFPAVEAAQQSSHTSFHESLASGAESIVSGAARKRERVSIRRAQAGIIQYRALWFVKAEHRNAGRGMLTQSRMKKRAARIENARHVTLSVA